MAGDPRPNGAVIWTRVAPLTADEADQDASEQRIELAWEVAEDDSFATIIVGGTAQATSEADTTAKVLVQGLEPDRWYHYRFVDAEGAGPIGRLRTAPEPGAPVESVRFAFCSCQQINDSLYVAQRAMSEEPDLDFFVHLGDYVYVHDTETLTRDDYRSVYHRFKANELLQQLQATVPIVAMFDDGEYYNGVDAHGDPERYAAGLGAWLDAFPVLAPEDDPTQVYRTLVWGDLLELFMLDLRSYRDPEVEGTDLATPEGAEVLDPTRTTLGSQQKQWLLDGLSSSSAAWKVLGNPYNMAMTRIVDRDPGPPRPPGAIINDGDYFPNEAWDDYPVERREVLQSIADGEVRDVVSVSGHTHVWIAGLLQPDPDDPASPVAAVDVTCGSLTADPDLLAVEGSTPELERTRYRALEDVGLQINEHLRYLNFVDQGYGLVEVTPEHLIVECKLIDPFDEDARPIVGARIEVPRGDLASMSVERFADAER